MDDEANMSVNEEPIIYLAETGILILKSKIPLNIWQLAIPFVMRTVIALPIIIIFTWLLF